MRNGYGRVGPARPLCGDGFDRPAALGAAHLWPRRDCSRPLEGPYRLPRPLDFCSFLCAVSRAPALLVCGSHAVTVDLGDPSTAFGPACCSRLDGRWRRKTLQEETHVEGLPRVQAEEGAFFRKELRLNHADVRVLQVKCDGLAPCGHCTSFGETCLFEEDTNSTRRSHLEALQARVLQQELRLQKIEALLGEKGLAVPTRPETDGSAAPTRPAYLPDPPPPEQETEEGPAPEVFPTFADDDADERSWRGKVGRLVVDARANARYIGAASTSSILIELDRRQRCSAAAASGAAQPQTLSNLSWLTSPLGLKLSPALPSLAAVERPDRELSDLLVEQYFDRLHLLCVRTASRPVSLR